MGDTVQPWLKSEEHKGHKAEMVVSYSVSFLGRCSLEIGGSSLMLSTGCVYWMLLSLEPPPTTDYPSLYSSHWFGATHSGGTYLFFQSTLLWSPGKRMALTKGRLLRKGSICFVSNSCWVIPYSFFCPWWSQMKAYNHRHMFLPKLSYYCLSFFS